MMPTQSPIPRSDLFIVDNSDSEWKVLQYLREWCDIARALDVATGYFEIGSLLAMDGQWQKLEKIRILMGDEVSRRTKNALVEGIQQLKRILDASLEREKETNDFLIGVPSIVEAIAKSRIEFKVYRKDKFHAKAYITHARHAVVGPTALVGSSNFTHPGLTENVELNVQLRREVALLQEWYERHWSEAEDVTPEMLRIIERHTRDYLPFEVYARSLHEFLRGHELTVGEWELTQSRMYPVLDMYQKQGYGALMRIARQLGGAFLCDGVGLGKTFVGLMAIERLIMHERKRVVLLVPKAARKDVWDINIEKYLPHLKGRTYSNLAVFNHTDLGRGGDYAKEMDRVREMADAVVIDEAHHFRNPGIKGVGERRPSRYRLLLDLLHGGAAPKEVFFLTATPVNNRLDDFRHMVELFIPRLPDGRPDDGFFKTKGIHSLRGHFIRMEQELRRSLFPDADPQAVLPIELTEAQKSLGADAVFKALVVQRSRAYVKESQEQEGGRLAIFPEREPPKVIDYSVKKTYGKLLKMVDEAFRKDKPLFILGIYYPLAYSTAKRTGVDYSFAENRQKQVVGLIRTQFLKRFESSAIAFEFSCERLLLKLLAWAEKHAAEDGEKRRLETWKRRNAELIGYVHQQQLEFWGQESAAEADEDIITDEMLEDVEELPREDYRVGEILEDTLQDLDQIADFLNELRRFDPRNDDKLKALLKTLTGDPVMKSQKVIIFTEFAETARYLHRQMDDAGISCVEQIDSASKKDRGQIIHRFSPYYNGTSSGELKSRGQSEIRILISTDVLSEGLNLQDATRLINYDLHWNPVRLMQRIGRVDRRMDPAIEKQILKDHPGQSELRGKVQFWNFLPPEELEALLLLYSRVSHKTLRISKTFGIEGRKLLKPDDDWDALRDFNHDYEGTKTPYEKMHLEYQQLLKDYPDLTEKLDGFPGKIFSGKEHPKKGARAVFFCYALPGAPAVVPRGEGGTAGQWTEEAGVSKWFLFDLASGRILEEPSEIVDLVRSTPETPRSATLPQKTLSEIRVSVEKHIRNTYLKKVQAPVGVKPILKCWMELG